MVAALLAVLGGLVLTPSDIVHAATSPCSVLTKDVHLFVHQKKEVNVLTYNSKRFAGLNKGGYTDLGTVFRAASKTKGLRAVRVLYDKRNGDRIYTTSSSEIKKFTKNGYADNGIGFYAYSSAGSCLSPVYRLNKGRLHRFVVSSADRTALVKQGWVQEKKVFYVAAPPNSPSPTPTPTEDHSFTVAVLPDTQNEVLRANDPRLANRNQWLVDNAKSLKLSFVTHTGDIVNWDTPDHAQFVKASAAMKIFNDSGIPYSLSPGNHDTAAVCPGGSACPGANTRATVRDTKTFNRYLNGGTADLAGRFQDGKLDNTYSIFTAGTRQWMVLNLELWPRTEVIAWAQQVVASHPKANVIVATHSYLASSNGQWVIYPKKDYGANSPQYLFDQLISKYPNIKMVLCGHVGSQAHRVDTGVAGNRIDTFLLTMHSNATNPVRLIQIDPVAGTLKTWVYAPANNQSWPTWTVSVNGLDFE
ncbi:MAG TPA: metallophosphoesterase [Microlunatus sp.]|nr:metallophosphoesterase [Microlunatus sp.]